VAEKYDVFLQVLEEGSLTRAAQSLGMTQSGVSHALSALEEELGLTLLRRSRSGIALTAEGQQLLPAIREIAQATDRLHRLAESLQAQEGGTIRVGTFTSVAVHWLPGILKEFQEAYPRAEIQMLNGDYGDVRRWLESGEIDVGFLPLPVPGKARCIPLWRDPLLAILPKAHRFARRQRYPLREIEGEAFISLLESSDQDARRAMEAAGVKPQVRFSTKDDYAIIAMVEKGLGMSILPSLLLEGHREDVLAMELEPPSSRIIGLAVGSSETPLVTAFAEFVRTWVAQIRPADAAPEG